VFLKIGSVFSPREFIRAGTGQAQGWHKAGTGWHGLAQGLFGPNGVGHPTPWPSHI